MVADGERRLLKVTASAVGRSAPVLARGARRACPRRGVARPRRHRRRRGPGCAGSDPAAVGAVDAALRAGLRAATTGSVVVVAAPAGQGRSRRLGAGAGLAVMRRVKAQFDPRAPAGARARFVEGI